MLDQASNYPAPRLEILVQPNAYYRLRYVTEMKNFHGNLKGAHNHPYPTIQLKHYEEEDETEIFIRVSLCFTDSLEPHVHKFAMKEAGTSDWNLRSHIDINLSSQNDFQAILKNLIIIRRCEAEWIDEEVEKQRNECMGIDLPIPMEEFKNRAKETWKGLKLQHNQFKLGFCAFKRSSPEVPLCVPLYSEVISNKTNASVGEMKIIRISSYAGKCGDELILLVSKIAAKSVKVRFFEGEANDPSWETYAQAIHNHHQVAITVVVPQYKEEIKVKLQIQLERTSDRSEAVSFLYMPKSLPAKRRLSTPADCSSIVSQRRSRTIGESSSEGNIQVQRSGQQLNTVQSWPNVGLQNQDFSLQGFQAQAGSSSQELFLHFDNIVISENDQGFTTNYQQNAANQLVMEGFPIAPRIEPNNPPYDALPPPYDALPQPYEMEEITSEGLSLDDIFNLPDTSGNIIWGVDLAQSTAKTREKGKMKHDDVVIDGLGGIANNNACGSTLLEFNKHKTSRTSGPEQQATTYPSRDIFFLVVTSGDTRNLEKLLKCMGKMEKEKLVNETNERAQTPLIIAVEENHDECVKLLCSQGANVNLADEEDNTPFHIAAKKKHDKCLEILLNVQSKKLDKKNARGETSLHLAVFSNNVKCVKMLIEAGANVNKRNGTAGLTPLHVAVQHGYTEIVRYLLQQTTIDIDEVNYEDKSATEIVKTNQEDIISLFEEFQGITVVPEEDTPYEDDEEI